MWLTISHQKKPIGEVELSHESFELKVRARKEKTFLQNLFSIYYQQGITGGVDKDRLRAEPLRSTDPRFIHELVIRLHALGYHVKKRNEK